MKNLKSALLYSRQQRANDKSIMINDINNTKRHKYKSKQDLIEYISRNYNISIKYAEIYIKQYKKL